MSRRRRIGGWVITGALAALFFSSASMKFIGFAPIVESFDKFDLQHMRYVIGIGEVASALLYAIPVTASLGVLLLSAYMGGAIVTHMANGEPYVAQSIILIMIWVGYYLRYPEMLISFSKNRATADLKAGA